MKVTVEIEIPDGKMCNEDNGCPFCVCGYDADEVSYDNYCTLLKAELEEDRYEVIKHPDCPSLKS